MYILAKMSKGGVSECSADGLYYQKYSNNVMDIKNKIYQTCNLPQQNSVRSEKGDNMIRIHIQNHPSV